MSKTDDTANSKPAFLDFLRPKRESVTEDEIKDMEYEATAGGGMVKVVATGDMAIKSIAIDPEAVDPEDVEMLQDMVAAAVNEALREATETTEREMSKLTGGMNIPGLM